MMVQPNVPMQHYATSGTSLTPASAQQVAIARQGSAAGSAHAPHIVKINKRPASRDHMSTQNTHTGSQAYLNNAGGSQQTTGLPQMP